MRLTCLFLLLFGLASTLQAQNATEPEDLRHGLSVGFLFGNRGNGIEVIYHTGPLERQITWTLELRQVKDPHEAKIEPFLSDRGRRYVFNKLNTLTMFNPMIGMEWDLAPNSSLNLINLRGGLRVGPGIGLVNPYYLEVCEASPGQSCNLVVQAYDPTQHNFFNIYGRASLAQSTYTDLNVQLGLSATGYLLVDMSHSQGSVSGMRLALHADAFPQAPPLLVETEDLQNQQLFVSASLSFLFGTRW